MEALGAKGGGGHWCGLFTSSCGITRAPINNPMPMLMQAALGNLSGFFLSENRRITCKGEGVQRGWSVLREGSGQGNRTECIQFTYAFIYI